MKFTEKHTSTFKDSFSRAGSYLVHSITSRLSSKEKTVKHKSLLIDPKVVIQDMPTAFQAYPINKIDFGAVNAYDMSTANTEFGLLGNMVYGVQSNTSLPIYEYKDYLLSDLLGAVIGSAMNGSFRETNAYTRMIQMLMTMAVPNEVSIPESKPRQILFKNFKL